MIDDIMKSCPDKRWNKKKLLQFKRAFAKAVLEHGNKPCAFEFEKHSYLVAYAAFLIEHLEAAINKKSEKQSNARAVAKPQGRGGSGARGPFPCPAARAPFNHNQTEKL
jgi:hypothetical protein